METRLERNKRLKKQKRLKRIKRLNILLLITALILSLEIVNQSIIDLDCMEDPKILGFDMETRELCFFGKTYIIDFSFLKNIKDQFLVF